MGCVLPARLLLHHTKMYTKRLKHHVLAFGLVASSIAAQRKCEPLSCSPVDLTIWTEYHAAAVELHNQFREKHEGTPCMVLDDDLTESAQNWAQSLLESHNPSGPKLRPEPNVKGVGQNMYFLNSMLPDEQMYDPESLYPKLLKRAITFWFKRNRFYKYGSNRTASSFRKSLVFSQVVWKESTKLGIGIAHERGTGDWSHYMKFYIVARYKKQGNMTIKKWNETNDEARARSYDENVGVPCPDNEY